MPRKSIRRTHSRRIKVSVRTLLTPYHRATSKIRLVPDFIIIGGQKCGTTSLFRYLASHPNVIWGWKKETDFFDLYFERGMGWYRMHFPLAVRRYWRQRALSKATFTGEASTGYLFHPLAAQRIAETLPGIKLIALLRNPVDRAYSHYQHQARRGRESLSFEEALECEFEICHGKEYGLFNQGWYRAGTSTYLVRGLYYYPLAAWLQTFPGDQVLILSAENLFANPAENFAMLQRFIGFPELWTPSRFKILNRFEYEGMSADTRARLKEYYEPHNRKLFHLLGEDYGWNG